jgi:DnaK suppressor protein
MRDQEKKHHSKADLQEFENLILSKLKVAHKELDTYKDMMVRKGDGGTSGTTGVYHSLENGAENGTYGICFKSGKLISKARLLAVPTTTQSIEEKLKQYN